MTWDTHTGGRSQHTERSRPWLLSRTLPIHLGLDVHKDTISVGILDPDCRSPRSSGSLTTRCRSAGSWRGSPVKPGCKPAIPGVRCDHLSTPAGLRDVHGC